MATLRLTRQRMARLIAEALEADGLTQAEFAKRVGATTKHVNVVLQGHSYAAMETLDYWAFVLGRHWTVDLKKGRA